MEVSDEFRARLISTSTTEENIKSIVTRDYDGHKMTSRDLIESSIKPWHERVAMTGKQLIRFIQSAINRASMSDDVSMAVVKSAIRYYF